MAQFEYNDLNKFYVSVGVSLIGITFLLPWLFLRENFDLFVKVSDLNLYTKEAQIIILHRQDIIGLFSIIIPLVSLTSFCVGTYMAFVGVKGWRKIQNIIEEREKLTNQKLSIEITSLSKEEKLEKVNKEVDRLERENALVANSSTTNADFQKDFKRNYIRYEKGFHNLIENTLEGQFKIHKDFKIGNREYDLLLESPLSMDTNYVMEIKYSESKIGQAYINIGISDLKSSLDYYKSTFKDNSEGRLVFLITEESLNQKSSNPNAIYSNTEDLINYENRKLNNSGIRISFFVVEKLESYTVAEVIKKLQIG